MATFVFMWCQSAALDSLITEKRKACAHGRAKPRLQLQVLRDRASLQETWLDSKLMLFSVL